MTGAEASDAAPAVAVGAPLPPWCDAAWATLAARAAGNTLPHALLVCGPSGLGKRALADAFVRARLCDTPVDGHACGRCRACALLAAGTHPDRMYVALEPNPRSGVMRREIVVDQIRGLSQRLAMASQLGGWQVALVDPAEAMNAAAQNALLKTLEEPTPDSLIVLVSDQPARLTATIRSRCQRVDLALPRRAAALAWLAARGAGDDEAAAALDAAGGNPGQAWRLVEHGGMQRRAEVARDLLALASGHGDARAIGKAWADDAPAERLLQAARLLEGALLARAGGGRSRFDPGWQEEALAAGFRAANHLRSLLDGPLRADLALFEWLAGLPHERG